MQKTFRKIAKLSRRGLYYVIPVTIFLQLAIGLLYPIQKAEAADFSLAFRDGVTIEVTNITVAANNWDEIDQSVRDAYSDDGKFSSEALKALNDDINKYAQGTYKDGKIDDDWDFKLNSNNCVSRLSDGDDGGSFSGKLQFKEISVYTPDLGCKDITGGDSWGIQASQVNFNNAKLYYVYNAKDTIVRIDGVGGDYKPKEGEDQNKFYRTNEDGQSCQDYIEVTSQGGDKDTGKLFERDEDNNSGDMNKEGNCYIYPAKNIGSRDIIIGLTQNRDDDTSNDVDSGVVTSGDDGGAADDGQDVCISSGFNLSWILCPIFNGVAEATDWIYRTLIDPFLYTPPVSTDPNTESFKVWSSFRVIGNIVLVIGMLVIVFGQSLGGGLIDAYTAKKILPRIIVAAILINLSVYFVAIAVDVSNILGKGIQQLMFAPFTASGMAEFEISGIQGVVGAAPLAVMGVMLGGLVAGGAAAGGGLIGGLAAIGAFWPVIGLTIILPAVLALLAVFVTLILRRALILFLVMVSPIAFAMYCLPNTEKYFKKWWEYFSKALLVYPIIAVMFALADILAITLLAANGAKSSNGVENGLAFIVAFVIQLIPIFIIPFAFKIAGGAIGSLYGTISGLGKKGSELAKGDARDPLSARNQAKFKARSALNDTNMSGAAMRTRINPFVRGANRRARLSSIRDTNQAMLGTDVAQAALVKNASTDDKVMTDLGFFATGKASRDAIDAETLIAMDEAKRNHDITNPASTIAYEERLKDIDATRQQKLAASATADRIGRTSSNRRMAMMQDSTIAYGLKGGEEGWKQAMGVFQELSNGDESQFRSMVNEFQYHAKSSAGRADLAGNVDSGEYDLDRATGSQNLYTLLNSKGSAVKALISQHKARLADPTATDDQKHKSAQFLNEMLGASAKSQGSGAIRDIINDAQADVVQPDGTVIMGTQKILDEHVRQQAAQRVQANPNDAAAWDAEFKAHADSILAQIRDDSREYTPINPNTQGAP